MYKKVKTVFPFLCLASIYIQTITNSRHTDLTIPFLSIVSVQSPSQIPIHGLLLRNPSKTLKPQIQNLSPPFIFHFNYGIRSHYWRRFCRLQRRRRWRRRRRRRRGAATAANSVADAEWNWAAAVSEQDVRHGGRPGDRPDTVVEPHQQQLRGLEPAGVR